MNYQIFQFTPSGAPNQAPSSPTGLLATGDTAPQRPLRVTPSALSALLYAILYSIEFQSPVGPRPPALRDHAAARGAGSGAGGGGGGAAAAPSAATLLNSAVSAMSSFWGRSSTTHPTAPQHQPLQPQQALEPSYRTSAGATSAAFPGAFDVALGTVPRPLSAAESAELAALQRQHDQPFVVPVIQVLHKLGGVHITVRETHNPTITIAYNRAMEEIEAIVSDHELRLARQPPPPPLPATSVTGSPNSGALASGSAPVFAEGGGPNAGAGDPHHGSGTNDRLAGSVRAGSTASPHPPTRAMPPPRPAALSPASPTTLSSSRSALPLEGSPVSDATAATWGRISAHSDGGHHSSSAAGGGSGGGGDALKPGPGEVGLLFTVRLLSKEVTRWRLAHERPLAEWRFPIIRTSNERMIWPRTQGLTEAAGGEDGSSFGGGGGAASRRHLRGDGTASPPELMLVNDPAQVLQVLEFILRSSYQTTSMETFTDFTSGELVFDAHVQESDFSKMQPESKS